jgi:hypothetical protein
MAHLASAGFSFNGRHRLQALDAPSDDERPCNLAPEQTALVPTPLPPISTELPHQLPPLRPLGRGRRRRRPPSDYATWIV